MVLAIDIQYSENSALAAGVLFEKWDDPHSARDVIKEINEVAPYVPGEFYKRELPCIKSLLQEISEEITYIVVDGYVYLGEEKKPGLGMYLYESLNREVPVIGVAKNFFHGTEESARLFRGTSKKPLFVTTAGIDQKSAQNHILTMHGENRNPTLLKRADQLCRRLIKPLQ